MTATARRKGLLLSSLTIASTDLFHTKRIVCHEYVNMENQNVVKRVVPIRPLRNLSFKIQYLTIWRSCKEMLTPEWPKGRPQVVSGLVEILPSSSRKQVVQVAVSSHITPIDLHIHDRNPNTIELATTSSSCMSESRLRMSPSMVTIKVLAWGIDRTAGSDAFRG